MPDPDALVSIAYGDLVALVAARDRADKLEADLREAARTLAAHECWDGDNFIARPFADWPIPEASSD